jgi:nicotinamidase/pyrazinamidase
MPKDRALVVIDVQNDFCPGGSLAVPAGDRVVPVINEYVGRFAEAAFPVFFTRDWHPAKTQHFQEWGGAWPPHCVQDTGGAAFHPALNVPATATVVSKGMDPGQDAYSAFQAQDASGRALSDVLKWSGVRKLYVAGLATDYCVKATVMDARRAGFDVTLLLDAMAGIDVSFGDTARALDEMARAGARTATLDTIDLELGESGVAPPLVPPRAQLRKLRSQLKPSDQEK